VRIPKENAHRIDLEWTEDEQPKLMAVVERYTSGGISAAWSVQRWRLACVASVLGDTEDRNDIAGQWDDEWALGPLVDLPVFQSLRETFLPMLVYEHAEYPEPDEDDPLNDALLPEHERHHNALPSAPRPQQAMLCCLLPGQVRYLKWWMMKYFADHVDIFHMYAEVGNDERTEMQLKFHDSCNPSVFVTTATVVGTGLNCTAANHAVVTETFWVLNEPRRAFARVVQLGQNRVPPTWLLNTGPGVYDNCASDLHQHSGVAQIKVLHGLMSRQNSRTSMGYQILESCDDHT